MATNEAKLGFSNQYLSWRDVSFFLESNNDTTRHDFVLRKNQRLSLNVFIDFAQHTKLYFLVFQFF
jgi:hypothetical protein